MRLAPKLQDTLDELVAVEAILVTRPGEQGIRPYLIRYFRNHSRCQGVALTTISARLRRLADLGLVERIEDTRPVQWRSTVAGREQAK